MAAGAAAPAGRDRGVSAISGCPSRDPRAGCGQGSPSRGPTSLCRRGRERGGAAPAPAPGRAGGGRLSRGHGGFARECVLVEPGWGPLRHERDGAGVRKAVSQAAPASWNPQRPSVSPEGAVDPGRGRGQALGCATPLLRGDVYQRQLPLVPPPRQASGQRRVFSVSW